MAKYSIGRANGGLFIYENDNEEPPQIGTKILRIENEDMRVAYLTTRALNARYNYEKKIENGKASK